MHKKQTLTIKSLKKCCAVLTDPRRKHGNYQHELIDIMVVALLAILAGASGWDEMHEYGKRKRKHLQRFLTLSHGIPSADTIRRVFERVLPEELETVYRRWVRPFVGGCLTKHIGIDGKTVCGVARHTAGIKKVHMMSAWVREDGISIGQLKVEEKSNEIVAVPLLLDSVDLMGAIVSTDAMGTQKAIAQKIIERGGHYLLPVKLNHSTLYEEIETYFQWAEENAIEKRLLDRYVYTEKGHGRIVTRRVTSTSEVSWLQERGEWKQLRSLVKVTRRCIQGIAERMETQYYISSLEETAEEFERLIRGHWSIENQLHWMLDVIFKEDDCSIHNGHAPENLSVLRKIALAFLKKDCSVNASIRRKRLICAWDDDFAWSLLLDDCTE